MSRKEIKIINKRTLPELETEINKYLLDHWQLYGTPKQDIDEWYTQCLIRDLDDLAKNGENE
jgi:hypothetical protein